MHLWRFFGLGILLFGLVMPANAEEAIRFEPLKSEAERVFIRVGRDQKKTPTSLETAIVRYVSAKNGPAAEADPKVNKPAGDGSTPLHLAASKGHVDVVKKLLEKGASPTVENKEGLTPIHLAAENGHKEVLDLLLDAKASSGVTVDLIGVVHIGEQEYYEELNDLFKEYDVLLYELVAPPNKKIPKDAKKRTSTHPIGMMQSGMTDLLDLDFQLHHIDYNQENFVHADMSPEQFAKKMEERGESFFKMYLKSVGQGIAMGTKQNQSDAGFKMMMAFFSDNRALKLKRAFAEQFESIEEQMKIFGGPEGSTIITERNKVALKVLKEQIEKGKTKIGIFYGAGHMPDMDERLLKQFKLKPVGQYWMKAWDMIEKSEK